MISCESTDESNYDDEVSYFTWKKVEQRITKARLTVSFDDVVETFKDQIKILKEHIFIKRVQNQAYNEHKASLTTNDLLVYVDFAEGYRNAQQDEIQSAYIGNQSFSLFTSCCYYKTDTDNLGQKSVVVVTEKVWR